MITLLNSLCEQPCMGQNGERGSCGLQRWCSKNMLHQLRGDFHHDPMSSSKFVIYKFILSLTAIQYYKLFLGEIRLLQLPYCTLSKCQVEKNAIEKENKISFAIEFLRILLFVVPLERIVIGQFCIQNIVTSKIFKVLL